MSLQPERGSPRPRLDALFQSRFAIRLAARAKQTRGGALQAGLDVGSAAVHAGHHASNVAGHVAMDVAAHAHHDPDIVVAEAAKVVNQATRLMRRLSKQATVQLNTESWSVSTVNDHKTYVPEAIPGDNKEVSFENLINALGGQTAVDNMKAEVCTQ